MRPIRVPLLALALALAASACTSDAGDDGAGAGDTTGSAIADGEVAAAAQGSSTADDRTTTGSGITVVGEGRVSGAPDTVRTTVGVEVVADQVDAALTRSNERAGAVIDAVREAGVAEEDVQTQQLSVRPQFGDPTEGGGRPEIVGYVATNLVEVRIRDTGRVGEVLSAAVEAGGDAARVQGLSFAVEEDDELLASARDAAFADARAKAEQYASLADGELGELVSISEQVSAPPVVTRFEGSTEAAAGPVPIEPGTEEVSVRITAVWALS